MSSVVCFLPRVSIYFYKMIKEIFSDHFAHKRNYLSEIDPRLKLFFVSAAIIVLLFSSQPYGALIISFLSLVFLLNIKIPTRTILLRLAAPLGIVAVVIFVQGLQQGLLIMGKVLGCVSLVIFLSMTTPVNKLLNAAFFLRIPRTWIEVAMLTYRYIFVLLEDAVVVRDAQMVRLGYSGLRRSLRSIGRLAGAVVVRAYDQSMAVYDAMVLRGYKGKIINPGWQDKFNGRDLAAFFVFAVILGLLLILR